MRSTITAVGLCATALTALVAILLAILVAYGNPASPIGIIGYGLAGAAIAGPLFGTIAASHENRWNPLLVGCAFGLLTFLIMFALS
jgi:hypothetical protein